MNVNATGIIFSNMHDEELHEITSCRTMGSLPFGGRYRIIDFALSNMRNSGITSVGVITKSNYQSLIDHLKSGKEWDLLRKREGLFIFPPYGRLHSGFYKNKIEALYGIMTYIKKSKNDYLIITDCDVVCNMNWKVPLQFHMDKKADITVIYFHKDPIRFPSEIETVYHVSPEAYVTDILINQKPSKDSCVGSNMWIIGKSFLETLLEDAMAHNLDNFERDIMQKKMGQYKIAAWEFRGYMNKINSISDFFNINMDILNKTVREDLFYRNGLIYTKVTDDIPARYGYEAKAAGSLVANGCVIEGCVTNSILFRGVQIDKGAVINNSILMPGCRIGENVNLNYVLADKEVIFNNNRILMGYDLHPIYIRKSSIV
jgi:glucose-1-phosphate adenylyltransferase